MITLFSVAFAVIIGLLMTRVVKPLGLPAVTAYLIAGVLVVTYVPQLSLLFVHLFGQ